MLAYAVFGVLSMAYAVPIYQMTKILIRDILDSTRLSSFVGLVGVLGLLYGVVLPTAGLLNMIVYLALQGGY